MVNLIVAKRGNSKAVFDKMITFNMVADCLEENGFEVLEVPRAAAPSFSYLRLLPASGEATLALTPDEEARLQNETLFVGNVSLCRALFSEHADACAVCVVGCGGEEGAAAALGANVLVLRCGATHAEVYACVQQCFARVSRWVRRMQRSLLEEGGLQGIIDESELALRNPMVVSDVGFRIVAYTKHAVPPEPAVREAIERGKFSKRAMDEFRRRGRPRAWNAPTGINVLDPGSTERDYPVVSYVFRIQGRYFLHLVMHCSARPLTDGLRDELRLFIEHVELYIKRETPAAVVFESGAPRALTQLALGEVSAKNVAVQQLRQAGVAVAKPHVLLVFDYGYSAEERGLPAYAAFRLMEVMPSVLVSVTDQNVIALCPVDEAELGEGDALRRYLVEYACRVGVSDPFDIASGAFVAHKQAQAALEVGKLRAESGVSAGASNAVLRFGACFADYFSGALKTDADLVAHAVLDGVPAELLRRDEANGTDDFAMLLAYLEGERRASAVAEQMHIHRTTLLYRVKRLEEAFGIDLDDPNERARLAAEFRLTMLRPAPKR